MGSNNCRCGESTIEDESKGEQRSSIPAPQRCSSAIADSKDEDGDIDDEEQEDMQEAGGITFNPTLIDPLTCSSVFPSDQAQDFDLTFLDKIGKKIRDGPDRGKKILELIQIDSLDQKDLSKIIYEEQLYKFSPGSKLRYVPRWAQLTWREFRYFKDRNSSLNFISQPLFCISFSNIEQIRRVDITTPPSSLTLGLIVFIIYKIIIKEK